MSEDFNEFRRRVLKLNAHRTHKITGSVGVKDAFHWSRINKLYNTREVSESDYYKIIRTVNALMVEDLYESRDVQLPQKMGQLEVRKKPLFVRLIDGKLITNRKIDWNSTLKLWNEDEEARESKTLVRCEGKDKFFIHYNRDKGNYPNKTLVLFKAVRKITRELNKRGEAGIIDAFTLR